MTSRGSLKGRIVFVLASTLVLTSLVFGKSRKLADFGSDFGLARSKAFDAFQSRLDNMLKEIDELRNIDFTLSNSFDRSTTSQPTNPPVDVPQQKEAPSPAPQDSPKPVSEPARTERPAPAPAPEPAPKPVPEPAPSSGNSLRDTAITMHNNLRARHQASPLSWSSSLAVDAQGWANQCIWGHSQGSGQGENLAIGFAEPADGIKVWAEEARFYNYGEPTPSNFDRVGHFTQMVWQDTTSVGCATAMCARGEYLVCRYSPPGNIAGQFGSSVKRPTY